MGVNKLAGLHLAEKLLCVAAHVARRDLIAHDLALGVDDERAALRQTVGFDQHLEIAGQGMGRVCQHGIVDLADAFGRIVPRLVDEMGIGGHRVDLAAYIAELLVLVRQILQLRRADEGEVRRIEEEYAPLAENVFLGNKLEVVGVIGIDLEIGYFLVDQRHTVTLLFGHHRA